MDYGFVCVVFFSGFHIICDRLFQSLEEGPIYATSAPSQACSSLLSERVQTMIVTTILWSKYLDMLFANTFAVAKIRWDYVPVWQVFDFSIVLVHM